MNWGVLARWHSIPLIAVVLIGGGFLAVLVPDDGQIPMIIGSVMILCGGTFAGFYSGFRAAERAERRKQWPAKWKQ